MPAEISARVLGASGDIRRTIVPCPVAGSESCKKPRLIDGLVLLAVGSTDWVPDAEDQGQVQQIQPGLVVLRLCGEVG